MEIRDRIKQKADELYRRYGVKSVTMDEIALQLSVSKKTIYQSFSDKNELVDVLLLYSISREDILPLIKSLTIINQILFLKSLLPILKKVKKKSYTDLN